MVAKHGRSEGTAMGNAMKMRTRHRTGVINGRVKRMIPESAREGLSTASA